MTGCDRPRPKTPARSASTASARWSPAAGAASGLAAASALAEAGAHVTLVARTLAEIEEAAARSARAARRPTRCARRHRCRGRARVRCRSRAVSNPRQQCRHEPAGRLPTSSSRISTRSSRSMCGPHFSWRRRWRRALIEAKLSGSIINISSQMGHVGAARRTVYCASKHAMEGFTKAMAIELAPHNIRVNSLGPDLPRNADDASRSSRTRRFATKCCRRSSSAGSASSTNSPAPSFFLPPTPRR